MTVTQLLKTAHFVVDDAGERKAAILDIEDWNRLVAWIEAISDARVAEEALAELATVGGDASRAGWIDWLSARDEWSVRRTTSRQP